MIDSLLSAPVLVIITSNLATASTPPPDLFEIPIATRSFRSQAISKSSRVDTDRDWVFMSKPSPWKVLVKAKGRHIVWKLSLPASVAGRHLPNWKTVHHLEKANQAAQLWRDDTLGPAGADGGEQPFINRREMREDSRLQPHTVWRHFTAPCGPILSGKSLDQDN